MTSALFPCRKLLVVALMLIAGGLPAVAAAAPARTLLASQGQARLPVVLGPNLSDRPVAQEVLADNGQSSFVEVASSDRIRAAAQSLADYLGRISGATFAVQSGDGATGIAVGLASDFPGLKLAQRFEPENPLRREEYLIQSHGKGLYLIGATERAVEHAVWDLLYQLGHRQFFPGARWEVIPQQSELAIAVDRFEKPDYHSRLIWYGLLDYNRQPYQDWCRRNRAVAGFRLNTAHEYGSIVKRNKEAFQANPELYAKVGDKRPNGGYAKFNAENPELQKLVVEDALRWFQERPYDLSKSMDPTDFGGWPDQSSLGSPTNQALTLANLVAEAATQRFGPRYVGMYAYYQHQLPPTIPVHPNVIISFATRFLKPGQTIQETISGWKAQGLAQLGIREYYSVYMWDWDMPDQSALGGSVAYMARTIPHFHGLGARFLTSEASDNWGPNGLGYYVASRILWDIDEARNVDALVADFVDKAFGPAREPMAKFYAMINGPDRATLREDMIGRMYGLLREARSQAQGRADVMARLDDLTLYTRYVELFSHYDAARGAQRQEAFEAMTRHVYRMRTSMMVHLKPLYERSILTRQDKSVQIPKDAQWSIPEGQNPWKSSEPFAQKELEGFIDSGLTQAQQRREAMPTWEPMTTQPADKAPEQSLTVRENPGYLLYAAKGQKVEIHARVVLLGFSTGPTYTIVSPSGRRVIDGRMEIGDEQTIAFQAPETGVYRLLVEGTPIGIRLRSRQPLSILTVNRLGRPGVLHVKRPSVTLYFVVPAGSEGRSLIVRGEGKGEFVNATLIGPDGQAVQTREQISGLEPATFEFPASEQPQVWCVQLSKPTTGYFGDVYLEVGPKMDSVFALTPEGLFRRR